MQHQKHLFQSSLPYLFLLATLVIGIPLLHQKAVIIQQDISVQVIDVKIPESVLVDLP